MEYVRVGNSGLKITSLTFGTALTLGTENREVYYADLLVGKAWEMGIRSFDTSNNYGMGNAEILLGKALDKYKRHEYVLATKGSWPIGDSPYEKGLGRKHILWTLEESLKRLNMEYIDIFYAHRYDPDVPMFEIIRTFNTLIDSGKIRYWATSEWPLDALEECHDLCKKYGYEGPVLEQFIYSYAVRKSENNGVMEFCKKNEIGMLGFSPLCQGYLTGKYRNGIPEHSRMAKAKLINYDKTGNFYIQNKAQIEYFLSISDEFAISPTALAIQWCIHNNVLPVIGASSSLQIEENAKALEIEVPNYVWEKLTCIR
jgi:aryl-alcohol dehydrogenase-like predicted oxidoreductase